MDELIRVLQLSISPVTLISGVGLLLMSLTNRFARTTDRARTLAHDVKHETVTDAVSTNIQIKILYRRSQILLVAISLALVSIFFVSVLIISLFAGSIFGLDIHLYGSILFAMSLIALILSLALFIYDMTLALNALRLELKEHI
jgi:hypothetical protein